MAEPVVDLGFFLLGYGHVLGGGLDHGAGEQGAAGHGQEPDQGREQHQPDARPVQVFFQAFHQQAALARGLLHAGEHEDEKDHKADDEKFLLLQNLKKQAGPVGYGDAAGKGHNGRAGHDGQPQLHMPAEQDENDAKGQDQFAERQKRGRNIHAGILRLGVIAKILMASRHVGQGRGISEFQSRLTVRLPKAASERQNHRTPKQGFQRD